MANLRLTARLSRSLKRIRMLQMSMTLVLKTMLMLLLKQKVKVYKTLKKMGKLRMIMLWQMRQNLTKILRLAEMKNLEKKLNQIRRMMTLVSMLINKLTLMRAMKLRLTRWMKIRRPIMKQIKLKIMKNPAKRQKQLRLKQQKMEGRRTQR